MPRVTRSQAHPGLDSSDARAPRVRDVHGVDLVGATCTTSSLNVGRGWLVGIMRARRLIHRQLVRVGCSGVTTQGRRCIGGKCIAEKVVEVGSVGLE